MGMPNVAFSHMGINTFDADRMAAFYKRLLGMVETDRGKLGEDREIIFLSRAATDHHQVVMVSGRTAEETTVGQVSFRVESLDDLRAMKAAAEADEEAGPIRQVSHGNAWSIYFPDPEGNTVEIFTDSPYYVRQPAGNRIDLSQSDEELEGQIRSEFADDPTFRPVEEWRSDFATRLEANQA